MKANEYRIGNLVNYRSSTNGLFKGEIELIKKKGCGMRLLDDNFKKYSPLKFIEGIPLTEEWLLKFGFVKESNTKDIYTKYGLQFRIWESGMSISFIDSRKDNRQIFTVHQLQNLYFAITREELTIK
jgi:hypothetical protein